MLKADKIVHTTCPYCGVGCQMDLHIRDNLIYRVEGRFDNQVNFGQLCVKGRFGLDFVHADDRLTAPLMRASRSDEFAPAEWEPALDHVAARLGAIRDEFGPDSVAVLVSAKCTNEENYLLQKFARAVIGTNNVDHCARL
ncbi:MAG: molybdopterin-dependent oxidoreductase [Anaerolineales bacterium]|nr:molybdopterin-dependent oxidoreductase [Anaerolineales bacterium]